MISFFIAIGVLVVGFLVYGRLVDRVFCPDGRKIDSCRMDPAGPEKVSEQTDSFRIKKDVGVRRIDEPGGKSEPALYEFYSVFPENTLKAGNAYTVTIQAYDRNNVAIKGAVCEFTLEN